MLNINNGFHWCIVNFCMKQSWLNEMGPRAGRAQPRRARHAADWPSFTLYFPPLHLEQPGALLPCERLPPESRRGFGAPDAAPGACWQPAVEGVSDKGIEEQRDQSELGECPQFSIPSGRRVVKRGEERRGERGRAFRKKLQGVVCTLCDCEHVCSSVRR